MNILIDIGHPGHVHLFKNFAWELIKKGHKILFTCREKEFEIDLLEGYGFDYVCFGKHYNTFYGKVYGLFKFNLLMFYNSLKFNPNIFLSHGSIYAAQVSFLLGKPHISMEDSGNMEQIRLYRPFTKVILTPQELYEQLGDKQIRYKSYHELAYLSPKYFTPNKSVLKELGILENERFAILRLVSWKATHDIGQGGLTETEKKEVIHFLSSKMKLFISAEGDIDNCFRQYLINIKPDKIHHALSFADIVVSEGATIASEAGVLGTPSIYINSLRRCYNEDQEKYGLVFNFDSGEFVLDKVKELENYSNKKLEFKKGQQKLLNEKIDLTSLLVWFIEEYPKSKSILKKNPEYQNKFRIENGFHNKKI